ncbi:hypothetical protein MMC07_005574 [Pseudocyphellaria aurata]|nr:hypothetical protein [Pseudocyphellaria aurata]
MAENILLEALPPKTDYVTYLTILEYNLTVHQLPILHEILQDVSLTANIGWDLVHLLLPLLPASRQCLQDVARLGNPREVVLKVTELIEQLGIEAARERDISDEEFDDRNELDTDDTQVGDSKIEQIPGDASQSDLDKTNVVPPSRESQFITLLEMLAVLHPRIKTKRPSRFLETALQAVLPTHILMKSDYAVTEAVLRLVKALSGTTRPVLPSRKSTASAPLGGHSLIAPDPEEDDDAVLAVNEAAFHNRLLLVFLTGIFAHYMSSLTSTSDIPGLAWCGRLQEKLHPQKIIPNRKSCTTSFTEVERLQERDAAVGQMLALARDLKVDPRELLSVIARPKVDLSGGVERLSVEADQVPLNTLGSLFILTAMIAASSILDVPTSSPTLQIFPDYAAIVSNFIGENSMSEIGTENEAVVDALLFLGFSTLSHKSRINSPEDAESFTPVLQRLSILSAECPLPSLRYHAHVLTTSILHSHPLDTVRLAFIHDTLEHCPYENLKGSAVGWLKDDILAAESELKRSPSKSVFLLPSTIAKLAPALFPNPRKLFGAGAEHEQLFAYFSFFLAALNLYYLLLSSESLYSALDIKTLTQQYDFRGIFLLPLREIGRDIDRGMGKQSDAGENEGKGIAEMELLECTIQMVDEALQKKGL